MVLQSVNVIFKDKNVNFYQWFFAHKNFQEEKDLGYVLDRFESLCGSTIVVWGGDKKKKKKKARDKDKTKQQEEEVDAATWGDPTHPSSFSSHRSLSLYQRSV